MADHVYECMFILDPNAYARDSAGSARSVEKLVADVGGELLVSRLWNEQKLTYPIKGKNKGAYWLILVRMGSDKLTALNRATQLNDLVLRHLFLKIDPRLVDSLVAVAKGEAAPRLVTEAVPDVDEGEPVGSVEEDEAGETEFETSAV